MMTPARTSPRGPRRAQLLALATAAGLAAALLAYFGLARQTQGATAQEERSVAIVVAAQDIPARSPLTLSRLCVRHLPASEVPAGSVATPEELAGQVTTAEVAPGQPVTQGIVTPRAASLGLAWSVAPSRRAVSVALDPEIGMDGFLEPGDHVDVLATFEAGNGQAVTRTILQDARLLAIGARTSPTPPDTSGDAKPAAGATLEVTPREAQALALASARGKLQLSLRGLDDATQPTLPTLPSADVTGTDVGAQHTAPVHAAAPLLPRPARARGDRSPSPTSVGAGRPPATTTLPRITVIRGTQTQTVTVGE